MPDPTPSAAKGILSAGIVVTLGGTVLPHCCATPDMGAEPERTDVTSFDDEEKKAYIAGLEDVSTLNFDFYPTSTLPQNVNTAQCSVQYPNGTTHSFTADVRYFMLAATPGDPLKARASCVVSDWGSGNSGT